MRRVGLALLLSISTLYSPGWCEDREHPPEPVGVAEEDRHGVSIHEAVLPGDLIDWVVFSNAPAELRIALLSEVEEGSADEGRGARQVWMWHASGEARLEKVGGLLPKEATHALVMTHGDGGKELLVAADGKILSRDTRGGWRERVAFDVELFPLRDVRGGRVSAGGVLMLRGPGVLQAIVGDEASGQLQIGWSVELPMAVDREWGGLRLRSPPVAVLESVAEGGTRVVAGPDTQGMRRIQSMLIDVAASGEPQVLETWSMLSNLEEVEESWYVSYRGEPALIVTTLMVDKHGVFEKKKLRLFSLTADRTREGSGPLLEAMTRSRNWYATCAGIADVDRDGVEDLISAQPKGLGAGSLWVEAHLGKSAGGFEAKVRGSEVAVEEGEICSLEMDVVADETVELIVVEDDSLLVFPLVRAGESKVVVESEPQLRIPFDDISGRPLPLLAAGLDPTPLIVTGRTQGGRQAVRLIRFP